MATWYSQGSGLWSTLANWNDAADGSGSAPANIAAFDDSPVVIQAGHVIEFDVEDAVAVDGSVSGWTTGIAGITITGAAAGNTPGELALTDTANSANRVYGLRLKANTAIVGTNVAVLGKVTGGTESVPLPTGAVHIIQFVDPPTTGGFNLTYLSLALYCAPPVETAYVTTANAGIGDSVLSVQGRLTSCNPNTDTAEWQVGRAVRVIRTTSAGVDTQATTIAAVGDGTITLSDNLTVAKPAGSLVVLEQRNIEIRDSAATSDTRNIIANGTGAVLDCAIRSLRSSTSGTRGIYGGTSNIVQGSAVISGCTYGIHLGTSNTVQGSAVISGCIYGIVVGTSHTVQGSATILGCAIGIYSGTSHTVQGSATISGCTSGIAAGTSHTVQGSAVISGCTYGIHLGTSNTVQGSATILGCAIGIYQGTSHTVQGSATISGCSYGIAAGTSHTVQGSATISGCNTGIYQSANALVAHTASITGCTTNYRVDTADDSVFSYATPTDGTLVFATYKLNVAPTVATPRVEIWPSGYEAAGTGDVTRRYPSTYIYGSYPRTWCNGGKTQSQTSVLPTGHTVGGQMIFEQDAGIITAGVKANYCWNWVAVPVTVGANQRARITVNVRKDTSFASYTETPMVQVVDALYDTTNIDTDTLLTSSMVDNEDTWQTYSFTVNDPGLHFVRIIGRHDTGNLYYTVTVGYEYTGVGGAQVKPARGWRVTDGPYDDIYRGLQGLWLMNEGSGTIIADSSGHGRHGTASGVTWVAGPSGWAQSYAAANATVTLPADLAALLVPTADYTVHVRARTAQAADGYLVACTDGTDIQAAIWSDAGVPTLTAGGNSCVASHLLTDNLWHSITAVVLAGTATLYFDGAPVSSVAAGATTGGVDVRIGTRNPGADDWDGEVDHAAIWSRALSASEVRRLHEQPPWMVG